MAEDFFMITLHRLQTKFKRLLGQLKPDWVHSWKLVVHNRPHWISLTLHWFPVISSEDTVKPLLVLGIARRGILNQPFSKVNCGTADFNFKLNTCNSKRNSSAGAGSQIWCVRIVVVVLVVVVPDNTSNFFQSTMIIKSLAGFCAQNSQNRHKTLSSSTFSLFSRL